MTFTDTLRAEIRELKAQLKESQQNFHKLAEREIALREENKRLRAYIDKVKQAQLYMNDLRNIYA